ncbi:hypothetical protein [Glaciihabitans sp. UYNi722]|uniref:hypothetical protein n=1 Tax=Glaciihabitans sp. UYNi722 TaxID=3156344 RepID=UPI003392258F
MAATQDNAAQRAAYWPVPIARAIPAAALALVITFSADHSAQFGLVSFGVFGIVSGIVVGLMAFLRLGESPVRSYLIAQGAITVAAGILALAFNDGGVRGLFFTLTAFAAITGFLELYSGLRSRRRFVASGDWVGVGVFTAVAALVFLLIPPGFRQGFTGPDGVHRVLDASVVVVGLLGAYAAIIAVYLLIAGLSAKWGTQTAPAATSADAAKHEETKA